jgi:hypothetical protein
MEVEPFRILISATQSGTHCQGIVPAGYALRILGNGIDKMLHSGEKISEVQAMYAIGLKAAYSFLWSEIEDKISNNKPAVEVVVRSPSMSVRFDQATESLFEHATTGKTKATSKMDVWLEDAVMATHFETTFRKATSAEEALLKAVEEAARAEARNTALRRDHL